MDERLPQLLGVVALSASDRLQAPLKAATGHGGAHPAALVHLGTHPGEPVAALQAVLGISQPATVKVVGRLVEDGLVRRDPGPDGRTAALSLTDAGRAAVEEILAERARRLGEMLACLEAPERRQLEVLLEKVVAGLAQDRREALATCRLCDRAACCGGSGDDCPLQHTVA